MAISFSVLSSDNMEARASGVSTNVAVVVSKGVYGTGSALMYTEDGYL